jgi:hypothetical protein
LVNEYLAALDMISRKPISPLALAVLDDAEEHLREVVGMALVP